MEPTSTCPDCGAPIPKGAPEGMCPECLFGSGSGAEPGTHGDPTLDGATPDLVGQSIGRYKLLQQIGEGGFGTVYLAKQTAPVKRRVALKVIKAGMDSKEVIARFEAERQALALMDHPNIAKVHDAGTTEAGRPYFVMELVKGVPITEYCADKNLDTKIRLKLFTDVCAAVQHAHQKGIIHRDLKPSNILVSPHDGEPVIKVIDFGIAKAISMELTEKTVFTQLGRMIGTPQYMSPEQAELNALDVDTRSDIYSLGVLLYELLTGSTPLDGEQLRSAAYGEMQRLIREETPAKPSTRISTLRVQRPKESALRIPNSALSKDLDWITMKALEKDRARRYETSSALALDIRRYLNDEPVEAGPPSALYRLKKLVRRNQAAVVTVAAVAAALVVGTIVSVNFAIRAEHEKEAAQNNLGLARYNEGLGWMLRAEVAEERGMRYPDTLLYAARAIGFDGLGRPDDGLDDLPRLIRKDRNPNEYERAHRWIRNRANSLPVWSSESLITPSPITGLAGSPAGRRLAACAADGNVYLWDYSAADANRIEIAPASASAAKDIAFHPDGKWLAVADAERVRFWDLEKKQFAEQHYDASVSTLAYSPGGRFLAGAAADGSILLWEDGVQQTPLETGQTRPASNLTFSPDGAMIAAVFQGVSVGVFFHGNREDRPALRAWEQWASEHSGADTSRNAAGQFNPVAVAFSPGGSTLAIGSENGGISLWDVATAHLLGEVQRHQRHTHKVLDLSFSHGGSQLASASADRTSKLWNLENDRLDLAATLNGHRGEVTQVAYLPGGMLLASAGAEGSARLWDVSGQPREELILYRYLKEEWYDVGTEQVTWNAGKGFLNLPSTSIVGMWQGGHGASDALFTRFIEHKNWGSAAASVTEGDDGRRREQLAAALLADAEAAAVGKRWNVMRMRLKQREKLGGGEVGEEKIAELKTGVPGIVGNSFTNGEGIEMVWCKGGTFTMGSSRDVRDPPHDVTLSSGFWIGKYELTHALYQELMERSPTDEEGVAESPAVSMTWIEAREFCRRLTDRERVRGAIPQGWEYDLPTEAQWEYACRAGTDSEYSFVGDDEETLKNYAWFDSNSDIKAHPVGGKEPNPWLLHDMHGNVSEWCSDRHGKFDEAPQTDPTGGDEEQRVMRGGDFYHTADRCRSARRDWKEPSYRDDWLGFRPALVPARPPESDI